MDNLLLVDCGTIFALPRKKAPELKAETSLKAMDIMGYDALNLGGREFYLGSEFLKAESRGITFPFIAGNLLENGSQPTWTKRYVIQEVNGVKVAILGLLPSEPFSEVRNPDTVKDLSVQPAGEALAALLPEIEGKADILLLLSQLSVADTGALIKEFPDIDLAITCGEEKVIAPERILQSGELGKELRYVQVKIARDGMVVLGNNAGLALEDGIANHEKIEPMVKDVFRKLWAEARQKKLALRQQETHKQLQQGLQMDPEKFFELMKNRQNQDERLSKVPVKKDTETP